jgi:lactate racemase
VTLITLTFGAGALLKLDAPAERIRGTYAPRGLPLDNVGQATAEALEAPVEFPALRQAVVPGDRVVLALEPGVPNPLPLINEVVRLLAQAGIDRANITLLRTLSDRQPVDPFATPPEGISLAAHDPRDKKHLAYLAASSSGDPIYLNRLLCEADMVVSIGLGRCLEQPGHGPPGGVFPTFSDTAALQRFATPAVGDDWAKAAIRWQAETHEASWLAGVQFRVEVVPGVDDDVLHVVAGASEPVAARARSLWRSAWAYPRGERAELVVAAISGAGQQTWANVGRALGAALDLVDEGGAIVLCTELAIPPERGVRLLAELDDADENAHRLAHRRTRDAFAAAEIAVGLAQGPVYLLSQLEATTVEALGLAPIEQPSQIARLVERHRTCAFLAGAQHAIAEAPLVAGR